MIIAVLVLLPLIAGGVCFLMTSDTLRRFFMLLIATAHIVFVTRLWIQPMLPNEKQWFAIDAAGLLFLSIASLLFFCASIYSIAYLKLLAINTVKPINTSWQQTHKMRIVHTPEAIYCGCSLAFLSAMTLVCASRHMGVLWVAIEATTLASAPLVTLQRTPHALEAAWKYLLICSIGIALALLGNVLLAIASDQTGQHGALMIDSMLLSAKYFDMEWLKAAFICLFVGYGVKMGLSPLHTWLPDLYSEAPSPVPLLSGALLNCAFLGILRAFQICNAAGLSRFAQDILILFGIISIATGTVFILKQRNYKRMLAYSSVKHMGILVLGIGMGGFGALGAMLHAVNHSLIKAMLFLTAGNISFICNTKSSRLIKGLSKTAPLLATFWLIGLFAINGFPPFGAFLSELLIFRAIFEKGEWWIGGGGLLLLTIAFVAMAAIMLGMTQEEALSPTKPESKKVTLPRSTLFLTTAPIILLCALSLILGCWIPQPLRDIIQQAAVLVGGN